MHHRCGDHLHLDAADGHEMVEKTATNYVTRYVDKVDGKVYVVTDDATAATYKLFINGKDAEIGLASCCC